MIHPIVSVIVPSYNHGKYIEKCLMSILEQTYTNFELIVIDDGSKDNSSEIIKKLQNKYKFIFVEQSNKGLSATFNRGIKEFAKGKYITFCASDDLWLPKKLELQVAYMEANPEVPMCYGRTKYMDVNSYLLPDDFKRSDKNLKGGKIFDDIFLFRFHPPVNYMLRKSIYEDIGYYDSSIYAEDYYMNLKIASKYDIGFVNDFLSIYRVDDSSSHRVKGFEKALDSQLKTINEYSNHKLYNKAKRVVYLRKFYMLAGYKSQKIKAIGNMLRSILLLFNPRYVLGIYRLLFVWK